MYIVPLAWLYVALMMSVAEATNSNGTVLGAVITFVLYGLLPIGIMLYLMGSPVRKRAIKARQAVEQAEHAKKMAQEAASLQPDAGAQAATDAVAPVGKEP